MALTPSVMALLEQLGLLDEVLEISKETEYLWVFDETLTPMGSVLIKGQREM